VILRLAPRGRGRGEEGAYAILYAALMVVLLAFGALVVDFATVRQDRRLNRSAADSAALGGVSLLDPTTNQGAQPYAACLKAWDYLATTLRVTAPAGRCSAFQTLTQAQITAKCLQTNPTEIADERVVGSRTFVISWPIPTTGSAFLTRDLAPGTASNQAGTTDGNPSYHGCDRLGVAIFEDEQFGLAGAFGASGTTTQTHSVALVRPQEGPAEDIAALNVLNPTQCQALVTTGNGRVTVGPALDDAGLPTGPGIIAVESAGTSSCAGQSKVIDPTTGAGSLICASATTIGANQCDGLGLILSHALDPGGDSSKAYNTAAVPTALRPMPTPENGIHGWVPVTQHYGCDNLPGNCLPPTPNYIDDLVSAYGGSSSPGGSHYTSGQTPYTDPYPGGFDSPAALCPGGAGITTVVVLTAGNHYANCDLNIQGGGAVIHPGGTLVVKGSISIASGGCLTMNTVVSTCPTAPAGSGISVTTPVVPTADAILFIQGNGCPNAYCFRNQGNLVIPQTFVYMGGTSPLVQNSTQLTLWTAPGAGARDGSGHTRLEVMCGASTTAEADDDCMDSRFGKLAFWSEYAAPSTQGHSFAGQGNLNVVGIFFTPRAYFNLTGGGGYTGSAAQFWTDKLNVNGGANLGLSPFESFSIPSFGPDILLIR
jgi:hypothetical protein